MSDVEKRLRAMEIEMALLRRWLIETREALNKERCPGCWEKWRSVYIPAEERIENGSRVTLGYPQSVLRCRCGDKLDISKYR